MKLNEKFSFMRFIFINKWWLISCTWKWPIHVKDQKLFLIKWVKKVESQNRSVYNTIIVKDSQSQG